VQTILPRNLSGTNLSALWAINRWIRQQTGTEPGLYVIDAAAMYGDPNSTTATPRVGAVSDTTYSYDGLHPKGIGALAAFTPVANLFNQLYPDRGYEVAGITDAYAALNPTGDLLTNPMMTFVGGTGTIAGRVTGPVPDGWVGYSTDAGCAPCTFTGVSSAATLADGTPAAQMVIAGTAGGGFGTIVAFGQNLSSFGNFSTGDKLQATCRVEVSAGTAHVTEPYISLTYTSGGIAHTLASGPTGPLTPSVADGGPATAYAGTLATPLPAPPLPGSLSGTLSLNVGVYLTNAGSQTVAGTFRVSACALRKVS